MTETKAAITALSTDPTYLASRTVTEAQTRQVLSELEAELAVVKARRVKILADIATANNASFAGDRRQLFALTGKGGLNAQDAEAARLILSISRQIAEARKRLATLETNAAMAAARKAAESDAGGERLFLVKAPNNGQIRHKARDAESLRSKLLPGYTIAGEIHGADDKGAGGVVAAINPSGPSILEGMLLAHGDDLLKFLEKHGIVGNDKTVVVLPRNGRELQ